MSLYRFVYYSAVIGGWAAFIAWLLAETLVLRGENSVGFGQTVVSIALVGAILAQHRICWPAWEIPNGNSNSTGCWPG